MLRRIGVPKKEKKCRCFFSLIEWHFFMHFYVPFHFLKVPFDFFSFQKQHFARLKSRGVPQKEEKFNFFFCLIERHFFMHFYLPFHFFKVFFNFAFLPNAAFFKAKAHRGTPKEEKCNFFFSLIERLFFMYFYRPY